jgi:hypothetical protein
MELSPGAAAQATPQQAASARLAAFTI